MNEIGREGRRLWRRREERGGFGTLAPFFSLFRPFIFSLLEKNDSKGLNFQAASTESVLDQYIILILL